jgi:circadian clock protein KaiC
MQHSANSGAPARAIPKSPTGIQGLDEITHGGLPKGRPTLICGGAGSGKTLLATSFLVHGAEQFGEPGVLMTFEGATHALHGWPARDTQDRR